MKKALYILLLFIFGLSILLPGCSEDRDECLQGDEYEQAIQPGEQSTAYFGDLTITLEINESGTSVLCLMTLSGMQIGAQLLTATQKQYDFDLQLAEYNARGMLTLFLGNTQQLSKVSGDFTYSVVSNNQSFRFKGDIVFWYNGEKARRSSFKNDTLLLDSLWMN